MSDAPERIWIEDERPEGGSCHVYDQPTPGVLKYATEYIRADIVQALTAERDSLLAGHRALNIDGARLETRIEKLVAERERAANWWKEAVELTQQARLQYSDEKARAEKAEAERDRLRAKLADAAVALDAAGMELSDFANCLSREPWAACLAYEAAIDARAALKGETP